MRKKVWLLYIFIGGLLCVSCTGAQEPAETVSGVLPLQDTLEMEPDFSYAVKQQQPHIRVDQSGYQSLDKKAAYFYGKELEKTFEVRDEKTGETVYTGTLRTVKEEDGNTLYVGIFTDFSEDGSYYLHQKQIGDSYSFAIGKSVYNDKYTALESFLLKEKWEYVSDQAYLLANYMFIDEVFPETWTNMSYIRAKMEILLHSQDDVTGAFYNKIMEKESEDGIYDGEISLSTTAQMAGVLAQYVYLYRETEDAQFISRCLLASQKAYTYMEKYRDNTDTDAWYYAAVQLYRLTGQIKYRTAVGEYDTVPIQSRSSTEYGYTILADFTYLSTPYGTDYNRCETLLDQYLDQSQSISTKSSREYFYVIPEIENLTWNEVLDDMMILGIVNRVLSGREYAGVQKNYIHYLSGVNAQNRDYLTEYRNETEQSGSLVKILVIYANLYEN